MSSTETRAVPAVAALELVGRGGLADGVRVPCDEVLLGRTPRAAALRVLQTDDLLSREHARVTAVRGGARIEDLGSTNGTFVNGTRIVAPTPLAPGDVVEVGACTFEVRALDDGAPPPPRVTGDDALVAGRAAYQAGRLDDAALCFEHATKEAATAADGWYGLGLIRMQRQDASAAADASSMFRRAIELDPNAANAWFQLGVLAERTGDATGALDAYDRAIAIVPDHAGASKALARLRPPLPNDRFGVYDYLSQDASPLSQQALALMEALRHRGSAHVSASLGSLLRPAGLLLALVVGALQAGDLVSSAEVDGRAVTVSPAALWIPVVGVLIWFVYRVAKVATTAYTLERGRLQIDVGVFSRRRTNLELWRIQDVELRRTLLQRMTGDGTVLVTTGGGEKERSIALVGIHRVPELGEFYEQLLNLVFLMRSNPVVKGIIS